MSSKTRATRKRLVDVAATWALGASGVAVCAALLVVLGYVLWQGLPVLSLGFIFTAPYGVTLEGGIFPIIVASLYVTALATIIVTPVGIGAAVYLAEYATEGRLVRIIRFGGDSLASVPSIVFGLFGLALFVYAFRMGWSMISGALTLALMMLPLVVRTAEDAILDVPKAYRRGSYGLGATKWQTVRRVVLPTAMPRILTGVILGVSRAFGEAAPIILTAGMVINAPVLPTDPGRAMPAHLYLLAMEGTNMRAAFGTALLLILVVLAFNLALRRAIERL